MAEPVDPDSTTLLVHCTFASAGTHVVCALSGGPDSAALVALAVAADLEVEAVHVDHGARSTSGVDARIAAGVAEHFEVPFRCVEAHLDDGPNFEARARAARRAILGRDALTGHTADDQAETMLLSLLRGAGATGLAAITPGPTKPLLRLRRADTHRLCSRLGLTVADDPTNADPRFRRNRIRSELLPLMDAIGDRDVIPLLNRTARLLRDDDALLDELAGALDPTDAHVLAHAPLPLARRAVRRWIIEHPDNVERHPPDAAGVARVLAVASGAAVACDLTGGWRVARSAQRLMIFPPADGRR